MECPECKENAVVSNTHGCMNEMVCEACGAVVSEETFSSEVLDTADLPTKSNVIHSNLPWEQKRKLYPTFSQTVRSGLDRIKMLVSALKLGDTVQETATELYKNVIALPEYKNFLMEKKIAFAVLCVYIIIRRNSWPMTITEISAIGGVSVSVLNKYLHELASKTENFVSSTPTKELISRYFLDSTMVEKKEVISITENLMSLVDEVWVTASTNPQVDISAAAYIAWSSLEPVKRSSMSYKKFCKNFRLRDFHTGPRRAEELLRTLAKLGEHLPWINRSQLKTKKYLLHQLETIFKYSTALQQSAVGDVKDACESTEIFRKQRKKIKRAAGPDCETGRLEDAKFDAESTELTEEDIAEESLHLYIRSEKEIEEVIKFSEKL